MVAMETGFPENTGPTYVLTVHSPFLGKINCPFYPHFGLEDPSEFSDYSAKRENPECV